MKTLFLRPKRIDAGISDDKKVTIRLPGERRYFFPRRVRFFSGGKRGVRETDSCVGERREVLVQAPQVVAPVARLL